MILLYIPYWCCVIFLCVWSSAVLLFIKCFFAIMVREWLSIDRLRLDKFYMVCVKGGGGGKRNYNVNWWSVSAVDKENTETVIPVSVGQRLGRQVCMRQRGNRRLEEETFLSFQFGGVTGKDPLRGSPEP